MMIDLAFFKTAVLSAVLKKARFFIPVVTGLQNNRFQHLRIIMTTYLSSQCCCQE